MFVQSIYELFYMYKQIKDTFAWILLKSFELVNILGGIFKILRMFLTKVGIQ